MEAYIWDEAILENGQLIWHEPVDLPEKAKGIITVLETIEPDLTPNTQTFGRFQGIWKYWPDSEKQRLSDEMDTLSDSWERPI